MFFLKVYTALTVLLGTSSADIAIPPENTTPAVEQEPIQVDEPSPTPIAVSITEELGGEIVESKPKQDCSCVAWARANSQFQPPKVRYAKELKITKLEPKQGSWIIFGAGYFGSAGHVGIVDFVNPEYKYLVTFTGFNFPHCQKKTMTINVSDPKYNVKGYYDASI